MYGIIPNICVFSLFLNTGFPHEGRSIELSVVNLSDRKRKMAHV